MNLVIIQIDRGPRWVKKYQDTESDKVNIDKTETIIESATFVHISTSLWNKFSEVISQKTRKPCDIVTFNNSLPYTLLTFFFPSVSTVNSIEPGDACRKLTKGHTVLSWFPSWEWPLLY